MNSVLHRLLVLLLAVSHAAAIPAQDSMEPPSRLSGLLGDDAAEEYERALTVRPFTFPADHGPHPSFRNEWWYVTGNLDDEAGRRFGFELTIFRFSLTPLAPESASAWRSNQVYIAHLAVTDADRDGFHVAQRYSRGAAGLAGAQAEPFRVWLDDWEIAAADGGRWRLTAEDADFGVDLELVAIKGPTLNGDRGLSQKSAEPGNASYYYSITRLATEGLVSVDGREYRVSGLSWLDREWSTSALAPEQVGWDWFALQLDDGTDLMFYQLRNKDGSADELSGGTLVDAGGRSKHLEIDDVELSVRDQWESDAGGRYPSRWTLSVPSAGLELDVRPVIADQELFTTVRYWEGAVDVSGTRDGEPVSGRGYVELTGYAE